jgi:hypothetical protein
MCGWAGVPRGSHLTVQAAEINPVNEPENVIFSGTQFRVSLRGARSQEPNLKDILRKICGMSEIFSQKRFRRGN